MKKVININFQGRVIPIEESAYDILKQYIESLTKFFANEEGKEEIINDIEGRIAELFGETLKKGATCICDIDVNKIIDSMGRPEDFEAEEANVQSQLGGEKTETNYTQNQQQFQYTTGTPHRLYRDEQNKILGGVCGGIANYFGIDPLVIRILSGIFFGITFIPYLILWVAIPSSSTVVIGSQRKRLFRDTENKFIAGVCSGLSQYFGISVWIPRLLFAIPFCSFAFNARHWGFGHFGDFPDFLSFSFSPGSLVIYIILWLVLPEAVTAADKLEMKGEKVDLNNIKNTIQGDIVGFATRAEKWGKDIGEKSKEWSEDATKKAQEFSAGMSDKSKQYSDQATNVARRTGRGLGGAIALIIKIFVYFIVGCVLFAVVAGLFGAGVAFSGLMPLKSYVLNDGWQTVFAWGALILFIWVPVIGIVTFIIRRLAKMKGNSNIIRYSFLSLWIVGLFCIIGLFTSLRNDFRYRNNPEEKPFILTNPKVDILQIKVAAVDKYYDNKWFKMEPFGTMDDDTVFVRNYRVRIEKALTDSFSVKLVTLANSSSRDKANQLAGKINFSISQKDSILLLDKGIAINRTDKFRNQHVIVTVAVPVGKRFLVSEKAGWFHGVKVEMGFDNNNNNWGFNNSYWDENNYDYSTDVEYIMTEKGPKRVHPKATEDENTDNENSDAVDELRNAREKLQHEVEEKRRHIEEQQRELKEKERELSIPIDSAVKPKPVVPVQKLSTQHQTESQENKIFAVGKSEILTERFFI